MTESEAKTKWCPILGIGTAIFAVNANTQQPPDGKCTGSACMMWRWNEREIAIVNGRDMEIGEIASAKDIQKRTERINGYCGLASKP